MVKKVILLLGIFLLLLGCVQNPGTNSAAGNSGDNNSQAIATGNGANTGADAMKVENGNKVKVEYIGKLTDGNIFDKSEGRGPLEFTAGAGQMIKGFDEAVIGMKLNEEKTVTLPPEKAYGAVNPDAFQWVPLANLPAGLEVGIGTQLMTSTGMQVVVVDVNADSAKIDFNHKLAGKTLIFWIKVVNIEK